MSFAANPSELRLPLLGSGLLARSWFLPGFFGTSVRRCRRLLAVRWLNLQYDNRQGGVTTMVFRCHETQIKAGRACVHAWHVQFDNDRATVRAQAAGLVQVIVSRAGRAWQDIAALA